MNKKSRARGARARGSIKIHQIHQNHDFEPLSLLLFSVLISTENNKWHIFEDLSSWTPQLPDLGGFESSRSLIHGSLKIGLSRENLKTVSRFSSLVTVLN